MTRRYCAKCHQMEPAINCSVCQSPLLYFGTAAIRLSLQAIIDSYNNDHHQDAISQFTGAYYNDTFRPAARIDILECEEMLTHNDQNLDALLFLGKDAISRKEWQTADHYLKKMIAIAPDLIEPWQLRVSIALYHDAWHDAITALKALQKIDPKDPYIYAHRGGIALKKKKPSIALICFYEAVIRARNKEEEQRFIKVVQKLTRWVEG